MNRLLATHFRCLGGAIESQRYVPFVAHGERPGVER
jgi:hypothetical protein